MLASVFETLAARSTMPDQTRTVRPGPDEHTVLTDDGAKLAVPSEWELLPPGDAGLTRRVKAGGPSWTVKEKKGRRTFSRGVWAPKDRIVAARTKLETERATPAYKNKMQQAAKRRDEKQLDYIEDFHAAVLDFLSFDSAHRNLAKQLASAVTNHATPVGSGTVARTQRIPIEKRAESAVIAWMRHQTTAYDHMKIKRVKGRRREVRRILATESRRLLTRYRNEPSPEQDTSNCPLVEGLKRVLR